MTYNQEAKLILEMTDIIQTLCPYDTGNLQSSIKYDYLGNGVWKIYVNCGDDPYLKVGKNSRGIAPYMPFTNEKWLSDRWKDKNGNMRKNPNEGWWNDACERAIEYARIKLNGEVYARN